MLEGIWAAGAGAEGGEGSEMRAGAVVLPLADSGAVAAAGMAVVEEVHVAAEGVSDEEALPCDWVEKAAEAWNYAKLKSQNFRRERRKQND